MASNFIGCDNRNSATANKCSTAATLTGDEFTLDGTTHTVHAIHAEGGNLTLVFTANIPNALREHTLLVGSKRFPLSNAAIGGANATWSGTGLT